ncbi:hypothetical protein C8R46DRAFT_1037873 [Mycena filopes]|nr:hypothetical protein C8R46DRAFT_1222894 [Mycena filopes]KAJ7161665.1 hypothetical protein C8R46DRAFT_1222920 [Mycena filopes]KAJ7161674.1 hypothetical protein C8R46DRAFT_1037873 [Mycena filopes]
MGIPAHIVGAIDAVTNLSPENFGEHESLMNEFWTAAGLEWVLLDEEPTLSATQKKLDTEGSFLLFSKVDPQYRLMIKPYSGTHARWKALKTSFYTVTFTDRLILFDQLISVEHNPGLHITKYIADVEAMAKDLKAQSLEIPDNVLTSILVARLHPIMAASKKSLCKETTFPDFKDASARLRADAHDNAKDEEIQVKIEAAIHGMQATAFAARLPRPPSGDPPPEAFEKGFRWCSPQTDRDCFRCGRPGHRAQFCMAVMPEAIAQWILGAISQASFTTPAYTPSLAAPVEGLRAMAAQADAAPDSDDSDDEPDARDLIPWSSLTPEQVEKFEECGLHRPGKLWVV